MSRKLAWTDEAWKDYFFWQSQDKKTLKRINKLIEAAKRQPFAKKGGEACKGANVRSEPFPSFSLFNLLFLTSRL